MAENTANPYAKPKRIIQIIAILLLFTFSIAPLVLAIIPDASNNRFSIYSTEYDGLSIVRNDLEQVKEGNALKYNVTTTISNLNILNRFNGSGALVLVGPAADFSPTETFSVLLYLLRGGSLIIADDFGTGNQILEPIFDLFANLDEICASAQEQDIEVPCLDDIMSGATEGFGGDNSTGGLSPDQDVGDVGDIGAEFAGSFLLNMLKSIRAFGFNSTAVLMDAGSNTDNPANPLITDIDTNSIPGMTFTEGVSRVQMEYGSTISLKLKVNVTVTDPDTGEETTEERIVWQPLQKISSALISDVLPGVEFDLSLPFFPLYSTKSSWLETDMAAAGEGTAQPDADEWGNAKFAIALSLPLFPGLGKIIFVADPSIFINRWTEKTGENDNLKLVRNIIAMATYDQELSLDNPRIPIIFDFGHTYQSLLSPILYSTAMLKLIAEVSMFPLYAPMVPFIAYGYGKKLMPKNRRLRPILLTKRRGEMGHSDFDKKLNDIKESGAYGEPISVLYTDLVRRVRSDPRFEGTLAKDPREMANFLRDHYPSQVGSRRELSNKLSTMYRIAEHSTRRMSPVAAKRHLITLKRLLDMLG